MSKKRKRRPQPSNQSEADKERAYQLWIRVLDVIKTTVTIGGIGFTVVGSAFCLVPLPIWLSHGEHTVIEYMVHWMSVAHIDTLGLGGALAAAIKWALWERKKRFKERGERDERIVALEQQIDSTRSSSNLSVNGKTREQEQ